MPRIRSIKPEFWTSGQVLECSTNARLLFIGLWNFADDAGRHPYRPKQIKAEVFPADDFTEKDIRGMIEELSENDLITHYTVDNKEYFQINGWHHQRIDKPQSPKHPAPVQEHSENDPGTIPPDTKGYDRSNTSNPEGPDDFDEFWNLYPRKEAKKKAEQAWKKLPKGKREKAKADCQTRYQHTDKQFIPLPTTYIHGERWEDEPLDGGQPQSAYGADGI